MLKHPHIYNIHIRKEKSSQAKSTKKSTSYLSYSLDLDRCGRSFSFRVRESGPIPTEWHWPCHISSLWSWSLFFIKGACRYCRFYCKFALFRCWVDRGEMCGQHFTSNLLGLSIFGYCAAVIFIVANPRWKRLPLPEEESLNVLGGCDDIDQWDGEIKEQITN